MNQGGKRILVLDRSRTIQILLAHAFQNAGHQVITCSKPQEALAVLSGLKAMPEVLVLDIDYEKEAYKVMRYVREEKGDTQMQLVAMVLQEEKAAIERALRGTTVAYLVKPFQIQQALALVSASIPGTGVETREREGNT
jgi:DNA-binding response OmpR family regulator